ncbi:MAG: glycosyltransferase family 4 protein [Limnothrix sp. RL_2_0]|nr:glycosyltransferase family 4 protein [Limnothrix sp. RL_2_0]
MGTWALNQAQGLANQNIDLQVVSFTSQVPNTLAITSGAKAYANCPDEYTWNETIKVQYPRWLYYPINPIKKWMYKNPQPYLNIAAKSAQKKLIQIIEKFQPDIIFCHHSLPNGWLVASLPQKYQKPLFVLEHDYDEIADCRTLPQRYSAFSQVANKTSALMGVSKRMENDLKSLFPGNNIFTHHNGISLPDTNFSTNPRPENIKKKQIISSCALFAERKGIPLLIRAFAKISPQHPHAILRIIGSGPDEENIIKTIDECAMTDKVQLLGKMSHDDVLQEIAWSDFFALVGWDEPFATVYLEAMALGKPIVCCSDGGITDVVENNVHALTVPPKDTEATANALEQLLASPSTCRQMGENAKSLIESSLTWNIKAKQLINYFDAALSKAP